MPEPKFLNKESEVYKQRQAAQELRWTYRARAIEMYEGSNVKVTPTSTPVVHENGAFIDAVVFIPRDQLEK